MLDSIEIPKEAGVLILYEKSDGQSVSNTIDPSPPLSPTPSEIEFREFFPYVPDLECPKCKHSF